MLKGSVLIVKQPAVFITLEAALQSLQPKAAVKRVSYFPELEHF
jgi:hypothetical protein